MLVDEIVVRPQHDITLPELADGNFSGAANFMYISEEKSFVSLLYCKPELILQSFFRVSSDDLTWIEWDWNGKILKTENPNNEEIKSNDLYCSGCKTLLPPPAPIKLRITT